MSFENRWMIRGRLELCSPLHIGSGKITERSDLQVKLDEDKFRLAEVNAVAVDARDCAYLPATTLKGNLRSYLRENGAPSTTIQDVFGSEDTDNDSAVGGKAEFLDAFLVADTLPGIEFIPYWNEKRVTGVSAAVAINRKTRTARSQMLRFEEFVPPGVEIEVQIFAQNLNESKGELELLLFALEGFNRPSGIRLGAHIGDGWGHCCWTVESISRLMPADVAAWLKQPHSSVKDHFKSLSNIGHYVEQAKQAFAPSNLHYPHLTLQLELNFDSPFLVNDPSKTKKDKAQPHDESKPDRVPLRDVSGRAYLPARSFRGALRSQVEKILRTLKPETLEPINPKLKSQAVKDINHVTQLDLASRLFGTTGWRAPLSVSTFSQSEGQTAQPFSQEFVAIDRFTGGGVNGHKFDAQSVLRPALTGCITLDLRSKSIKPWMLGLLALTLRDLIEGDITFGFGASRGYGASKGYDAHRTRITSYSYVTPDVPMFTDLLQKTGLPPADEVTVKSMDKDKVSQPIKDLLTACLEDLHREIADHSPRKEESNA